MMLGPPRLLSLLMVIAFGAPIAAGDETPPAESRFPSSTMQFAVVRDISALRGNRRTWTSIIFPTNLKSNDVPDSHDRDLLADLPVGGKMLLCDTTDYDSPVRPDRWSSRVRKEAAAALFRDTTGELAAVWLIDAGDDAPALMEDSEWTAKWLQDRSARRTETTVRDHAGIIVEAPNRVKRRGAFQRVVFLVKGTYFMVGTSKESLEMVLDRWDGTQKDTLAQDEAYQRVRRRTASGNNDPEREITWFRRFDDVHIELSWAWYPGKLVMALLNSRFDATGELGRDLLDDTTVCSGGTFALVRDRRGAVSRQFEILRQD